MRPLQARKHAHESTKHTPWHAMPCSFAHETQALARDTMPVCTRNASPSSRYYAGWHTRSAGPGARYYACWHTKRRHWHTILCSFAHETHALAHDTMPVSTRKTPRWLQQGPPVQPTLRAGVSAGALNHRISIPQRGREQVIPIYIYIGLAM